MPKTLVTFCKPPTLGSQLLNHKNISHGDERKTKKCGKKCLRCGLCGNHSNLRNMVSEKNSIKIKNKTIKLNNNNMNCKSYGIYAAMCKLCRKYYVGQTKNSFSSRFNGHRTTWKNYYRRFQTGTSTVGPPTDEQSLFYHYTKDHIEFLEKRKQDIIPLSDAYEVIFLEQPSKFNLDWSENFWISELNAGINVTKTFLPKYK